MTNPPSHQPRPPRPSRARPTRRGSAPGTAPWQSPPETAQQRSTQTAGQTTDEVAGQGPSGTAAAGTRPAGEGISALSAALLEVLRCPLTRGRLFPLDDRHLMSDRPYREGVHPVYEVIEGIPHMLPVQGDPARARDTQTPEPQTRGRAS